MLQLVKLLLKFVNKFVSVTVCVAISAKRTRPLPLVLPPGPVFAVWERENANHLYIICSINSGTDIRFIRQVRNIRCLDRKGRENNTKKRQYESIKMVQSSCHIVICHVVDNKACQLMRTLTLSAWSAFKIRNINGWISMANYSFFHFNS